MCKISFGWGRHVVSEKTLKPMWEGRGTAHPNSIGHGAARSYASVSTVIAAAVWYEPGHQSSRALVAPSFPHSAYIYICICVCWFFLSPSLPTCVYRPLPLHLPRLALSMHTHTTPPPTKRHTPPPPPSPNSRLGVWAERAQCQSGHCRPLGVGQLR